MSMSAGSSEVKLCEICQSQQVPLRISLEEYVDTGHNYELWEPFKVTKEFREIYEIQM